MKREDSCEKIHQQQYGKSDKANAACNQNPDFQEGYAWGIETFAFQAEMILKAEIAFRSEFTVGPEGFEEWKRGLFAARLQMASIGIRKRSTKTEDLFGE